MKQVAEYIIPIIQDGKNCVPDFLQAKELIRCKDCIHCADDWNGNQPMHTCELGRAGESVQPNDYCSYAEHEVTS